jgi:hypothetical protein
MRRDVIRQRGQALMATIIGISLVLLVLLTTLTLTDLSRRLVARELTYNGQTVNVAQAGLTEGLSWFRRQTTQPVTTFAPVQDLSATPPIDDTETPATGLVRTYPISASSNVWARYELRKTGITGGTNTIDISSAKGLKGNGIAWQVESIGSVWIRNDSTKSYNQYPNKVLATRTLRSEIQRLAINLPCGQCALSVNKSNVVTISNTDVKVIGGANTGIAWVNDPSGGSPSGTGYNSTITGTPKTSSGITASPNKFTIGEVFGVTLQQLRGMADLEVTAVGQLPTALPQMKLIILNNSGTTFTFDQSRPLTGSGVLVVLGNLNIAANSNSVWNGLIYVQGSYTQRQPSTVNGSVIVYDTASAGNTSVTVTLAGAGEKPTLRFDSNFMNFMTTQMGLYNTTRAPYDPCTGTVNCQ